MRLIVVTSDGRGFVERDSGRPYIPFGTNYYDPHTGWAPKLWRRFDPEKVREHFRVMGAMGVNCARVFLTTASFQPDTLEFGAVDMRHSIVLGQPLIHEGVVGVKKFKDASIFGNDRAKEHLRLPPHGSPQIGIERREMLSARKKLFQCS